MMFVTRHATAIAIIATLFLIGIIAADRATGSQWYKSFEEPLAIVGIITFIVIGWQAWETRKAAEASKRSVEIVIKKERAVIEVRPPSPLDFDNPTKPQGHVHAVSYDVFFHCPVGAIVTSTSAWVVELADPWVRERETFASIQEIPHFVKPATDYIKCQTWIYVTSDRLEQIRKRERMVHFYGLIKYRDIVMDDGEPDLSISFHYVWVPPPEFLRAIHRGDWMKYSDFKLTGTPTH